MKRIISGLITLALVLGLCSCGQKGSTWQEQYDLGMRYMEEGNYEEAIIAFTAAIEIDPKRAEAYLALADAYIATEDYENAKATLERALEQVDDVEAIQAKLEYLEELLYPSNTGETTPADDKAGGDENQPQTDSPDAMTAPGDDPDEPGHEDEPGNEPEKEPEGEPADMQEIETNEGDQPTAPVTEPEQPSKAYKTYQYAADAVNTATLWDMYMTMEQKSGYTFDSLSLSGDGAGLFMEYRSKTATVSKIGTPAYISFVCSVPVEVYDAFPSNTDIVETKEAAAQILALCDSCVIESVSMSCDSSGMKISSVFKDKLSYGEIIRICEENGYAYTERDNESYGENYLNVEFGNGKTVDFTWMGYWGEDISGVAPTYCSIY